MILLSTCLWAHSHGHPSEPGLPWAYGIAVASTAVPIGLSSRFDTGYLGIAGLVLGPSTGSVLYSDYRRALIGTAVRAGSCYLFYQGAEQSVGSLFGGGDGGDGVGLMVAGGIGIVSGVLYSLLTIPASSRERAERRFAYLSGVIPYVSKQGHYGVGWSRAF